MWWIIIAIIAFVAFKFILDSKAQSNAVAKQGGMRKKYSILVDYFLTGNENCRIIQEIVHSFVSVLPILLRVHILTSPKPTEQLQYNGLLKAYLLETISWNGSSMSLQTNTK